MKRTGDKLVVEYLKASDLLPYARNSRTHDEAQVAQIAASIKEFGFTNPILISETNDIIAGHGRLLAAQLLEMDEVPCIRLIGLTDLQRRAYVIADNRLAENSGWDASLLALELEHLHEQKFEMNLLGFDPVELDKYLNGSMEEPVEATGSQELNQENFEKFDHKCPKCSFEFDD